MTNDKAKTTVFPSTLTQAAGVGKKEAKSLMPKVFERQRIINGILTKTEFVSPTFQGHYFDVKNVNRRMHGLKGLIIRILTENAMQVFKNHGLKTTGIFDSNYIDTCNENEAVAFQNSFMTTEQIIDKVKELFSLNSSRYIGINGKAQSVKNCLSTYMKKDGTIGHSQTELNTNKKGQKTRPVFGWYAVNPNSFDLMESFEFDLSDNEAESVFE